MSKLWILLPVFNEGEALKRLIEDIAKVCREFQNKTTIQLVIVDDGSSDGCTHNLPEDLPENLLPLTVITHEQNQGLGQAMSTGIQHILAHANPDTDLLISLDADGSHLPQQFNDLLNQLSPDIDIVIASRYQNGAKIVGLSWLRTFLSQGAGWMYRLFVPIPQARDYTCGYRLYRISTLKTGSEKYGKRLITESGFACMGELLIKLHRSGARVTEIPLQLHYDRKESSSKMNIFHTVLYTMKMLIRLRSV